MAKTDNLNDFLKDIANAIREKTGKENPINAQDFSREIADIKTKGNTSTLTKSINFYDCEGTILYSYTKDEFLILTELPSLPEREGLICQEWNWNLDAAKIYVQNYGKLDIGATYITDDGKTRFYIKIVGERKTFPFKIYINKTNSLIINWGDGTTKSISGSGSLNVSHTYSAIGDYVISFEVAEGAVLTFSGSSSAAFADKPYSGMLRKIEFGERISIGSYAFYTCYPLTSVVIPNNVTSIGNNAFCDCFSLSSVIIPNGVTNIANYAFSRCASLAHAVIPNSVTSIGDYAFHEGWSLSSITIPGNVKSIGSYAFYYCRSLASAVIPSSVTGIRSYAFYACYPLTSVVIPNGVTKIESYAFGNCFALTSIVIPNSITSLETYALNNCYSLYSLFIPNSVKSIGTYALQKCYSLAFFDFRTHTSVPTLVNSNAFLSIPSDSKIVVPDELYNTWKAATNWSYVASYIVKASEFNE